MPKGMPCFPPTPSQLSAIARLHEAGFAKITDLRVATRDEASSIIKHAAAAYFASVEEAAISSLERDFREFALNEMLEDRDVEFFLPNSRWNAWSEEGW